MANQTFDVVFAGRLVEGADPAQVRANLAKAFKTDAARIDKLFSGERIVIKKGLDANTARNYQVVLAKAGAVAEIVAAGPAAASPAPAQANAAPASVSAAPTPAPAAPPRAPDFSIAEVGVLLIEPATVETPDIDTSHLSVAEVGVTLAEPEDVPEPQFDLSGLQLDPPGTTLVDAPAIAPAEYDTSALALVDS